MYQHRRTLALAGMMNEGVMVVLRAHCSPVKKPGKRPGREKMPYENTDRGESRREPSRGETRT